MILTPFNRKKVKSPNPAASNRIVRKNEIDISVFFKTHSIIGPDNPQSMDPMTIKKIPFPLSNVHPSFSNKFCISI